MIRTRLVLFAACVAATATACAASAPNRVRDLDGNPLPPYALSDTGAPVVKLDCNDGRSYLLVTDLPADLYAPALLSTYRFEQPGVSGACGRILVRR
jgi:hypothetical protein